MAKRRKKAIGQVPPMCNCLLLCDDVLISQGKGKHFLQGVIGIVGVSSLPAMIGGYVAYIRLSDVHGSQNVTISFVNARTGEPVIETKADFPSHADPLGVYTLVIPVPAFAVNEEGRYLFMVTHDGVPIAQTPVIIKAIQRRAGP
ncbi:MAG: DUF6941 family protein [Tepidisphaerales bacterium]